MPVIIFILVDNLGKSRIISFGLLASEDEEICNCDHFNFTGFDCRHSFAVLIKNSIHPHVLNIHPRWIIENLPNLTEELASLNMINENYLLNIVKIIKKKY